jgi:hypothetical protein
MKKYSENTLSKEDLENISNMRIYGFEDSMAVARSIMGSIHENLLKGDLVFAYRSTAASNKTTYFQVVVVNDLEEALDPVRGYIKVPTNKFSVSTITSGYSAYIPHMPIEYLEEVIADMEDGKVDKKVIVTFKAIVEDLMKSRGGNK